MKNIFKKIVVTILRAEAKMVLAKYHPHIVAVTGSVGKTSTKDAIFAVLAESLHVRKSNKSFNSEIGLPLTILGIPNAWNNPFRWMQNILDGLLLILLPSKYPTWLVLEVGADRPGDISSLASWLPVDIAVITRLPDVPVHVEFFTSPEEVVKEKLSLIDAIKKDGTLLIYADQKTALAKSKAEVRGIQTVLFGLSHEASVRLDDFEAVFESVPDHTLPLGMQATLHIGENSAPVAVMGVLGIHSLIPILAAAAVAQSLSFQMNDIVEGISKYEPPRGRMRLLPGIKDTLIIDDTYNASPAAVEAALEALVLLKKDDKNLPPVSGGAKLDVGIPLGGRIEVSRGVVASHDIPLGRRIEVSRGVVASHDIPLGRRIAVLGDMLELGKHSVDEHKKIGKIAAQTVDILITVGFRARDIAEGALNNGMAEGCIFQYEDSVRAGLDLQEMIQEGDCILVKGSQSIRTEKIVAELMKEPERARELLVRQESDWKKR